MSRKKKRPASSIGIPGGLELRNAREARGLSLRALSELAGVTIHTIMRHELGYTQMRLATAIKVVGALNRIPRIQLLP